MQLVSFEAFGAPVIGYLQDEHDRLEAHRIRPALIVCPGGGYYLVSPREADPPALAFAAQGYNVFILTYSILEQAGGCRPLRQLAETLHIVRRHSAQWHVDPERIAVMGFSAGGHLAASLGSLWNDEELALPADCRPNAMLLCYPVISLLEHTHLATSDNVSAGDEALRQKLSVEKHITPDFPPTFLWHTVDDDSVPVENSLMLMQALRREQVPFEAHLFAHGAHGISTCTREVETPNVECRPWLSLCQTWLNKQFHYEP